MYSFNYYVGYSTLAIMIECGNLSFLKVNVIERSRRTKDAALSPHQWSHRTSKNSPNIELKRSRVLDVLHLCQGGRSPNAYQLPIKHRKFTYSFLPRGKIDGHNNWLNGSLHRRFNLPCAVAHLANGRATDRSEANMMR